MNNSKWYELILNNEKAIKTLMRRTRWQALHSDTEHQIILNDDGTLNVHESVDHFSYPESIRNGTAIMLISYCFEFFDGNAPMEQHYYVTEYLDEDYKEFCRYYKDEKLNPENYW